jgi:hypothetical protein
MFKMKTESEEKKGKSGLFVKILIGLAIVVAVFFIGGFFVKKWFANDGNRTEFLKNSATVVNKVAQLLPINKDTKKEIEVANKIFQELTKQDGVERRYLVLLQNNMELRPGGGFLGQYVVMTVKNGQIEKFYFEDANLLDQRINVKVAPPYPLRRKLSLKKWKFRDSNFSPDFPENVKQAKRFYRYAGGNNKFDGVFAVNATVLNDLLEITGPISLQGGRYVYNSENAISKLEEQVEKPYLFNENLDTQNRKWIMKKLAEEIKNRLSNFENVSKLIDFSRMELAEKNIQLYFEDENLQKAIQEVGWSGEINKDWSGDYLMLVDANLGALKSDYFVKRSLNYNVDLTGEIPKAVVDYKYNHTATHGDWRTSDYHSYIRLYVPKGSKLTKRVMVSYPITGEEFNKTYFGVYFDALMNRETTAHFEYDLPMQIKEGEYRLLIQKQSGLGDVPVHIHLKNDKGEFDYDDILKGDLIVEFGEKEITVGKNREE